MIRLYSVSPNSVDDVLVLAGQIIDESGIADALMPPRPSGRRAGRPPKLPQYTARAVLMVLFHLAYANMHITQASILRWIWIDYTPEQLEILGLGRDWRCSTRASRIGGIEATLAAEDQRLRDFIQQLLLPIDDSPLPANRRHTNAEFEQARAEQPDEEGLQRRLLRDRLLNRLVAASVARELLDGWHGNLAVDEHEVTTALYEGRVGTGPDDLRAANQLAGFNAKNRRHGMALAVGATFAILAADFRTEMTLPRLALGIGFDYPSAASISAALAAIDGAEANGLCFLPTGRGHRFVITDKAYVIRDGWHEALLVRGFSQLAIYPKDWKPYVLVKAKPEDLDGPRLVNGVPVCPGMPVAALRTMDLAEDIPDDAPLERWLVRIEAHDRLLPFVMPTNGRPQPAYDRGRGRPCKDATTPGERVFKLKVVCPAAANQVRCELIEESMGLDKRLPLAALPIGKSTTCTQMNTTITLDGKQFKRQQPMMAGTPDHYDLYHHARGRNESFHAELTSRSGGALGDRTITAKRAGLTALIIAMCTAATNIKLTDAWQQDRKKRSKSEEYNRAKIAANRTRAIEALKRERVAAH
jgi:hypothetical protein